MPRSRNIYNAELPYHICARTNDSFPFPCELQEAWTIYCDALWFYSRIFQARILAFVTMSNHFHLIITASNANLSEFMKHFMKRTSDNIRAVRGIKNHLYGDRYYPSLINNQRYFQTVLKYVYQNPIRAGICESVLDYKYSTLPGFLGFEKMEIPTFDDYNFFDDLDGNLKWLDDTYGKEAYEQIKKGLKQQEFKPERDKNAYMHDTLLQKPTTTSFLTHRHS
jgi:putative transposase